MYQCNVFKTNTKTYLVSSMLAFICLILLSCANPLQPADREEESEKEKIEESQLVKAELENRSFRQFDPSRDANKRKAVILDFFSGIGLWAQYAEGNTALSEWEILADDYSVEKSGSEYRIYFDAPRSVQILPTQCDKLHRDFRDFHFDSESLQ